MNPARFLRHVEQTPACWFWTGNLSDAGNGRVRVHGRLRSARRVAYELWVGPIPSDAVVRTCCGQSACVRPDHLELVRTLWVPRLTPEDVRKILRSLTEPPAVLAAAYHVSERTIYRVRASAAPCRQ